MYEGPNFQWQNEVLLKTIYPLRALKLQDFLVYFREVEMWAEYQSKSDESLLGQKQAYVNAQKQAITEMKDSFYCLKDYFKNKIDDSQYALPLRQYFRNWIDVKALKDQSLNANETNDEYLKISKLHNTCHDYLDLYKGDLRKEKIFMTQRLTEWQDHYKELFKKSQRVQPAMGQEKQTNPFDDALKIAKAELDYLHQLISFYNKVDTRRGELIKPRKEKLAKKAEIEVRLAPLKLQVRKQRAIVMETEGKIRRIQTQPDLKNAEEYFSLPKVSERIGKIVKADTNLLNKFSGILKTLNSIIAASSEVELVYVRNKIQEMEGVRDEIERRISALEESLARIAINTLERNNAELNLENLRNNTLNPVLTDLEELKDLEVALELDVKKTDQAKAEFLGGKQKEYLEQKAQLDKWEVEANAKQVEFDEIDDYLKKSSDENLLNFISDNPMEPEKVDKKDIVRANIEKYRKDLAERELPELLEIVVRKFLAAPEEYPLWLQYMVIHFSGMRYASAHGSWADPKDLLINLSSSSIAESFTDLLKMEDANDLIQALCQEKFDSYTGWEKILSEEGRIPPKMMEIQNPAAKALEPREKWKEKLDDHLQALQSDRPDQLRKSLLDFRIDEATYEIESKTPEQVLDVLRDMKEYLNLPKWMWDEIVKLTELRVTEANKDDWERPLQLTSEIANSEEFRKYGEMMTQWKKNNLTSWREAHEDTDRLIVTRAVCNEVAEHIQHLRGHRGGAGLTSKPDWYQREVNKFGKPPHSQQDDHHPYFIKPKVEENYTHDFQVGASILWLRFVFPKPDPWQIAKPLATRDDDPLVPHAYINRKTDDPTVWKYLVGEDIQRHRKEPNQNQLLRWLHEATVAKVAETADGPTVLTFETALPNEDRRLSTIGIFKRDVSDLLNDFGEDGYNASFVGFVPEGVVSAEDIDEFAENPDKFMENQKKFVENLEEMLDWNKILQREIMKPEELDAWQEKFIRSKLPAAPPKLPPTEEDLPAIGTTHPTLANVANRTSLRAWRVKWDWEEVTDFGTGVRKVAPDPCVFRCGELEDNKNGHYVELTEAWQWFWFELCCKVAFGCYSKSLSDRKRIWMGNRWEALGGNWTAFTNQHGLDVSKNFVLRERLDKNFDYPMIYTLVGGGATLTGEVVRNSKGVEMLKVDHFNGNIDPPAVDSIDPYADPRIFFANIITRKEVKDSTKTTIGYRVVRFPQFRGKEAPVPLIANTDIYYPLCDLEEITTGVKAPAYFP